MKTFEQFKEELGGMEQDTRIMSLHYTLRNIPMEYLREYVEMEPDMFQRITGDEKDE